MEDVDLWPRDQRPGFCESPVGTGLMTEEDDEDAPVRRMLALGLK